METSNIKKIKLDALTEHSPTDRENFLRIQEALRSLAGIPPGSQWFTSDQDPAAYVGTDGDYSLNTESGDLFRKERGAWTLVGNIKGSTINTGNGPP